jgi:O-antigen/teichoic acid export membrane protein
VSDDRTFAAAAPSGGGAHADEKSAHLRSAAVTGLRWSLPARLGTEVLTLASMVVLARLIAPAEFGHYAVALVVGEIAMVVPGEGVGSALVQRQTLERVHLQAGMVLALVAGAVLAAIMLALAALVVVPIFGESTAELVRLSTPSCLIAAASAVPTAVLRRRLAFRRLSVMDIVSTGTRAVASVGLALAGLGAESLVLGGMLSGIAAAAIAWTGAWPPPPRLHLCAAREVLDYGLPAALASISWVGFRNCDYAIVGARLGAAQTGFYFRAYSLAVEYQKKISIVMSQIGFPVLARAQGTADGAVLRHQMVRLLTTLLFPLLTLLAVLAPVAVPLVFGADWKQAVVPTQILALGGASTLVIDTAGVALMAAGRARALLAYGWGHFTTYAAAVFVAAPHGLAAVAVGASIVHTAFLYIAYALVLRGTGRSALACLWDDVAPATVSCAALAAAAAPVGIVLSHTGVAGVLQASAVAAVGTGAYLLALRLVFPSCWRDMWAVARRVVPARPAGLRAARRGVPAGAASRP